jgi:hypothetical protein
VSRTACSTSPCSGAYRGWELAGSSQCPRPSSAASSHHAGVVHAFFPSLETVFLCAVPLMIVGFLVSWLLREIPLWAHAHVGGEVEGRPEMVGEAPDNSRLDALRGGPL